MKNLETPNNFTSTVLNWSTRPYDNGTRAGFLRYSVLGPIPHQNLRVAHSDTEALESSGIPHAIDSANFEDLTTTPETDFTDSKTAFKWYWEVECPFKELPF